MEFKIFEARYRDHADLFKCIEMFMSDLKIRLEEIKSKFISIAYKNSTHWDENFVKFLQFTVSKVLMKIDKSLPNAALQEYVGFRDLLSSAIDVSC